MEDTDALSKTNGPHEVPLSPPDPEGKLNTHYYKTMFHRYHNNAAVSLTNQYFY